jgi:hypothetical protein
MFTGAFSLHLREVSAWRGRGDARQVPCVGEAGECLALCRGLLAAAVMACAAGLDGPSWTRTPGRGRPHTHPDRAAEWSVPALLLPLLPPAGSPRLLLPLSCRSWVCTRSCPHHRRCPVRQGACHHHHHPHHALVPPPPPPPPSPALWRRLRCPLRRPGTAHCLCLCPCPLRQSCPLQSRKKTRPELLPPQTMSPSLCLRLQPVAWNASPCGCRHLRSACSWTYETAFPRPSRSAYQTCCCCGRTQPLLQSWPHGGWMHLRLRLRLLCETCRWACPG